MFDRYGNMQPVGLGEQGLYHAGRRFLRRLEPRLEYVHPLLLNSTGYEDNVILTADLTNPGLSVKAMIRGK